MRAIYATVATLTALVLLAINHVWLNSQIDGLQKNVDFGIALPAHTKFLIQLNHFAIDFGYVLLPLLWIVVFFVTGLWAKGKAKPGDASVDPSTEV